MTGQVNNVSYLNVSYVKYNSIYKEFSKHVLGTLFLGLVFPLELIHNAKFQLSIYLFL